MVKTFIKKNPVQFEYEGKVFDLPGELPIAMQLKMKEIEAINGSESEVTIEDMISIYRAMLGDETTEQLVALGVGHELMQEILVWYQEQITSRQIKQPQDHKGPNVIKAKRQ